MERLGDIPIPENYNGNIDLNKRKVYHDPKTGKVQTEFSIGIGLDPGDKYSISIPTIVEGKPVSNDVAREHFNKTGEHLGYAHRAGNETPQDFYKRVDADAQALHERQAKYYNGLGAVQ